MAEPEHYRLELDAAPESLAVMRLFVATVLRVCGADESDVDDAKLAISELATVSVLNTSGSRLTVTVDRGPGSAEVALHPFHRTADMSPDPVDIAAALFATTVVEPEAGRASFSVDLGPH